MKTLVVTTQFKRDLKLCKRRHWDLSKLTAVMDLLANGETLSPACRDHPLLGRWIPKRECHIAPDWLLVYETTPTELRLARTGTHADLFGL